MKNGYITEYANFAYFDLELHDLDLDPRSHGINHKLSPSMACYIKKERIQYLSVYLSCMLKCVNLHFDDLDLENVPIDPIINRLRLCPMSYYGTYYHLPKSNHARKKWETDRHTDK